jgi:hypothetical protein
VRREVPQSDRNYGRELTDAKQTVYELELELVKVKREVRRLKNEKGFSDCK